MRGYVIAAMLAFAACSPPPTAAPPTWRAPPPNEFDLPDPPRAQADGVVYSSPEEMGALLQRARAERAIYHRLNADNEVELSAAALVGAPELRDRILARALARCRSASADELRAADAMVAGAIAMRRNDLDGAVSSYLYHFAALPMIDERDHAALEAMQRAFEVAHARAEAEFAMLRLRFSDPQADLGPFAEAAARYDALSARAREAHGLLADLVNRDLYPSIDVARCEARALDAALDAERRALVAEQTDQIAVRRAQVDAARETRARLP